MNVKNILKKQNLMPVIVLSVICLVTALLLGGINLITAPKIKEANEQKIKDSLEIVMPDGEFGDAADALPDGAPETVKQVFTEKNGKGFVVVLETNKGYTGKLIGITVAIDTEGKIIKSVITKNEESIVPSEMKPMGSYGDAFIGATGSEVADVVTGATVSYSESAIKSAIYDACVVLGFVSAKDNAFDTTGITETTVEEALEIAERIGGTEYELIEKDEDMPNTVRSVFREKDGKGYAFHIATRRNKWSPIETEGIVTSDKNGRITAVEMMQWVVGFDKNKTDKAPEMTADILNSYIGKNKSNIAMVDHATHATESSDAFMNAVRGALEVAYPASPYTVVGIVIVCVCVLACVGAVIFYKKRRKNG